MREGDKPNRRKNMSIETKHTPTPWVASKDGPATEIGYFNNQDGGGDENYWSIAKMMSGRASKNADADFIVRACNVHDELLAALRHALTYVGDTDTDDSPEANETRKVIRAAIAKAQAEMEAEL